MRTIRIVIFLVALLGWAAFVYALCQGKAEAAFDYALWALMFTTFAWLTQRETA